MPLGNEIGKFLWNIAEKKNGFDFGKPWKQSSKSLGLVIPILRTGSVKRKYKMMEEVKGKIDIEDTGHVNIMRVVSKGDENTFIRSGIILEGGGQTRAVISGMIVLPNSTQDIDVKCVYASKPTQRGAKMHISDIAPPIVMQSLHESQRDTWDAVSLFAMSSGHKRRSSRMGFRSSGGGGLYGVRASIGAVHGLDSSPDDDLLNVMRDVEKSQKDVEGAIKDIPVMENQVGCIIFNIDSIVGFEVFDSPESWKSMHKQVIKKYNEVLRKEQEKMLFELKPEVIPEKIAEFVEEICKSDEKTSHETEVSRTIVVDGERHVGEYTTIGADVIHIIMFKRSTPKKKDNPSSGGYRQPRSRIRSSLEPDGIQEVVAGLQMR